MKILIVGIGSIGKRHLKNLIHLGYKNICLVRRNGEKLSEFNNFKVFPDITHACNDECIDFAIIATPTAIHFQNFRELANYNVKNIYIEKPITHDLKDALAIEGIARKKKLNVIIGYDLHFDLGLNKVRELLQGDKIGQPLTFQSEVGQYLPDWRPHEDYRNGMSAKKSLGGGVMLDLIHEFDYVNWIFGPVESVIGKSGHNSNLEIDTEDFSLNIIQAGNGVHGSVYLDYLQKELSRLCKIVGNNGTIIWDYKNATVRWMTHKNPDWEQFEYKNIDRNDRFIAIIKAFMNSPKAEDARLTTVSAGIESLRIVMAAKKSSILNKMVKI